MANVNRKWASGIGQDGQPIYAPLSSITVNGRKVYNPKDKHYAAAKKFKEVVNTPPIEPAPEGYHYEPRGWTEAEDKFRRVYEAVENPPAPPKVYSTSDLIYALMSRGVYEQCRQWIEEQGLRDLILATKEFTDDLESFETIKQGLQNLLNYTDEQVAEVLAEAEVG